MTRITMIPVLQYRWQLECSCEQAFLVYYGLRNPPENQRQKIPLDNKTAGIIRACDGKQTLGELLKHHKNTALLYDLISRKIVVDQSEKKSGPEDM
ncbi:MAG: hypothetical protein LUQ71_03910 [Methanoregula sp.]|nr:hypothetical protein [Methanoregula sp.]